MSLEWKKKTYEDPNYKTLSPFLFGITNYHVILNIVSQFFVFTLDDKENEDEQNETQWTRILFFKS